MENIPPSIHSSSQKNFKLCRWKGLPTKAPQSSAICIRIFFLAVCPSPGNSSRTFFSKKSLRLWFGSIVDPFWAEYLNAFTIIFHITLLISFPSSRRSPSSPNTLKFSPQVCIVVLVAFAKSRMGLWSVPWIQLGPRSTRWPDGRASWWARPPILSRASSMVTLNPCWSKMSAHRSPASPAPTTHISGVLEYFLVCV